MQTNDGGRDAAPRRLLQQPLDVRISAAANTRVHCLKELARDADRKNDHCRTFSVVNEQARPERKRLKHKINIYIYLKYEIQDIFIGNFEDVRRLLIRSNCVEAEKKNGTTLFRLSLDGAPPKQHLKFLCSRFAAPLAALRSTYRRALVQYLPSLLQRLLPAVTGRLLNT